MSLVFLLRLTFPLELTEPRKSSTLYSQGHGEYQENCIVSIRSEIPADAVEAASVTDKLQIAE